MYRIQVVFISVFRAYIYYYGKVFITDFKSCLHLLAGAEGGQNIFVFLHQEYNGCSLDDCELNDAVLVSPGTHSPVTHTIGPMLARYWSTPALPNQPRANIGPIVCVTWVGTL